MEEKEKEPVSLIEQMNWTRAPKAFCLDGEEVTTTTEPHTDLWQRTYYHFRNDNAPLLQAETEEKFFSFVVKTDFSRSHHRHPGGCENHVVSPEPPGGRLLCGMLL